MPPEPAPGPQKQMIPRVPILLLVRMHPEHHPMNRDRRITAHLLGAWCISRLFVMLPWWKQTTLRLALFTVAASLRPNKSPPLPMLPVATTIIPAVQVLFTLQMALVMQLTTHSYMNTTYRRKALGSYRAIPPPDRFILRQSLSEHPTR